MIKYCYKMAKLGSSLTVLFLYLVNTVYSSILSDLSLNNECTNICELNLICQRGCRLFNLIDAKGNLNLNKTKIDCYASCIEAYNSPDYESCKFGCTEMQKKKENELSNSFILFIEQEGQNNLLVVQPDSDQTDLDVLSDPSLQSQLYFGYSASYKIPEAHIRTMPINDDIESFGIPPDITLKHYQPAGDWLDCASKNSGIPRWMLIFAILLAILLGLWLILTSDKQQPITNLKPIPNSDFCETCPDPPPKYVLEPEKV